MSHHIFTHPVSLHVVVYLISERNLATKDECSTLLLALAEKVTTFGQTVLSVQSTKTHDVVGKTADILEESKSFPTAAKQLRGKCLFCLCVSIDMKVGCMWVYIHVL